LAHLWHHGISVDVSAWYYYINKWLNLSTILP
jgi:hypothetical protein